GTGEQLVNTVSILGGGNRGLGWFVTFRTFHTNAVRPNQRNLPCA
ncbi:MAG: hypothetical protein RLZZ366_696, partial [Pseudomonadota bacterium]